ncbi:unnamed protein product [Medioppia subpectinata]|uniref:Pseudouridylate synthase 1 homolog n=1 Tax=Medioppia subpectinata TaxID=1979941 RepID=A0A7R9KX09_9ACAR|nr:unnamed protein product [Medioppia subpectinata]CAG2111282.1 unnamed protein product [Medioppia subpectinata]
MFYDLYYKTTTRLLSNHSMDNALSESVVTAGTDEDNGPTAVKRLKTEPENTVTESSAVTPLVTTDTAVTGETVAAVAVDNKEPFKRIKLHKWVLLLSYCGQKYFGMQRQTDNDKFPTIEYRLFDALFKSGLIDEEKLNAQHMCQFQRAARTDRGVSAIKQIVSIKLPVDLDQHLDTINEHLPEEIRLMASVRVTKNFDAKNYCDARTYSYLMPSYALCPLDVKTTEDYRIADDVVKQFNDILKTYLGSHNYHNFTSGKAPTDASAYRYIVSMDCSPPFLMNGLEFVVVRVRGQSFMLHQIRKMIGLAIAVMRGITNTDAMIRAFAPKRIDIPKAPGLGLLLEEVHYEKYNEKYGGDGVHEPIAWDERKDAIDAFKHRHIYPVIANTEKSEKSMFVWLQTLVFHTYDERKQKANDLNAPDAEPAVDSDQTESDRPPRSALWSAHRNVLIENAQKSEDNTSTADETNNGVKVEELPSSMNSIIRPAVPFRISGHSFCIY